MAWTNPKTWVNGEVVDAAELNTYLRDNLRETMNGKATTAGRFFATTGANAIAEREVGEGFLAYTESTNSTSFVDLGIVGPSVTLETGPLAVVFITAWMKHESSAATAHAGYEVSGATSVAATDRRAARWTPSVANHAVRIAIADFVALTPGTNTFTMKYKASSGRAHFSSRQLIVLPF